MSQLAAHMQKFKIGNLGGLQRHDERQFRHHANKDIDIFQSSQNFSVLPPERQNMNLSLTKQVQEIIADERISNRAVRKDAVVLTEWVISSDSKFFEGMSREETKQFFTDAYQWFADRFGANHIPYATVHMDETTPHMHMGVIPLTDGRLSAKSIFNREALRFIQADLPEKLSEKGWQLERGEEGSKRKHLTVERYKEVAEALNQGEQIFEVSKLKHEVQPVVNKFHFATGEEATQNYILTPEDHQKLAKRVKGLSDLGEALRDVKHREKDLDVRESRISEREKELDKREAAVKKNEDLIETYDYWYDMANEQTTKAFNLEKENSALRKTIDVMAKEMQGLKQVVKNVVQAVGVMKYGRDYQKQPLSSWGSRLVDAVANYTSRWLRHFQSPDLAEEVEKKVVVSRDIGIEMDHLVPRQNHQQSHNQDLGRSL